MMRASPHKAAVAALIALVTAASIGNCSTVGLSNPTYTNALSLERNAQVQSKVGECGMVLSEELQIPRVTGSTKRHMCMNIQKYGFLTRYIRWEFPGRPDLGEISDTCLLVAYCGDQCRQIHHPTASSSGAQPSEAKSREIQPSGHWRSKFWHPKAGTQNAEYPPTGAVEGTRKSSGGPRKPSVAKHGSQAKLLPTTFQGPTATALPESGHSNAYAKYSSGLLTTEATTRSFAMLDALNCNRLLKEMCNVSTLRNQGVSRVYRNDVYKLRIAAAHGGMIKFWGRLAAFIGAASITDVAAFEEDTAVYSQMLQDVTTSRLAKKTGSMRRDMAIRALMLRSTASLEGSDTNNSLQWIQTETDVTGFDARGLSPHLLTPRSRWDDLKSRMSEKPRVSSANSSISLALQDDGEPKLQISVPLEILASFVKQKRQLPQPTVAGSSLTLRKLRAISYAPVGDAMNQSYAVYLTTAAQCAAAAAIIKRIPEVEDLSRYILFRSR